MQAKDIMTVNVISVSEDTPVHEVVGLLLKYRISAVPVVDSARKVVGIVSEGDLLRPEGASRAGTRRPWWLEAVFAGQPVAYEKAQGRTAGAVMTRNVITVDESTPLNEIAELLERHHIKRVPVLSDGRLAGIVSRANLLHGLANTIVEHHEPGAAKDRQLRHELMKILLDEHKLDTVFVNVTVTRRQCPALGRGRKRRRGRGGRRRGEEPARREVGRKQSRPRPDVGRASVA